jgi:two-component system, NtrC family, response regulator HydG
MSDSQIAIARLRPESQAAFVTPVSGTNARILIVEDDGDLGLALSNELALAGYRCELALSGPAALKEVEHTRFDAIISDLRLDEVSGLDLLETLTRERPTLPVIIVTGFSGVSASDAMDKGAFHHFTKPLDVEELRGVIEQAIGDRRQLDPLAHDDALLPTGSATRKLIARIERFATTPSPVLIRGESGTGKELVARALHARGPRAKAPFIAVNTAAIPEHLLESELFGHVRGAFSGATQARRGMLTEADGGTILLDEIGDMPLGLQAKLLRVVQFGEVRAIGSDRSHFVDVRFLAATHRNLKALAAEGTFRADLYYRLSVLELHVPALRDRRSEIPALVTHFLARARDRKPDSPVRVIAPDAMRVLSEAPWLGNIRELASTIERLVVLGEGPVIGSEDLELAGIEASSAILPMPPPPTLPPPMPTGPTLPAPMLAAPMLAAPMLAAPMLAAPMLAAPMLAAPMLAAPGRNPLSQAREGLWTLERLNHEYVEWVLGNVGGNKLEAARILGINISTLYRWLRDWPSGARDVGSGDAEHDFSPHSPGRVAGSA